MANYPDVGIEAPDFTAPLIGGTYDAGSSVTLSELRGQPVVLYFYPKDDTPGCTTQACEIRDAWPELEDRAQVIGVSVDSIESHEKFIDKYELSFPLVSDTDQSIAKSYGVWVEKNLYGKKYMGTERTSFVIDAEGILRTVFARVKPAEHVDKVLQALDSL